METIAAKIKSMVLNYGPNVLYAIGIVVVGMWLARLISRIAEKAMSKSRVDLVLVMFAKTLIYYGLTIDESILFVTPSCSDLFVAGGYIRQSLYVLSGAKQDIRDANK